MYDVPLLAAMSPWHPMKQPFSLQMNGRHLQTAWHETVQVLLLSQHKPLVSEVACISFQELTLLFKLFQGFATAHGLPTNLFVDDVLGVFLHIECLLQRLVLTIYSG